MKIKEFLTKGIQRVGTSFFDPWDWEHEDDYLEANQTALSISERSTSNKKPVTRQELEWKCYPTTRPQQFEENSIGI
ncbi:Protein kinase domain containing protein [Aphelenchoides avenae]|nr:Protein kinase domain containing protein [Aphelenchus avenae]